MNILLAQVPLFPEQASTVAPKVDNLFFFISAVSIFFTLLIAGAIIFFAIRFRRRPGNEHPRQFPSNMKLEITWSVIPLLLTLIMFGWGVKVYFEMIETPDDALEIYVVAKQWMWNIQHMSGQRENQTLHIPAGRPVKLTMTSQDVIHDFAIPTFRVKQDVVPGRYTTLSFTATKPGKYRFFCAEYCGTNHSQMIGWVIVMEPGEFQTWLASPDVEGSMASKGRKLFLKLQCLTCHSGTAQARAPLLEDIYRRKIPLQDGKTVIADEKYLRESILHPDAKIVAGFRPIMPPYQGQVNEEELLQLIEFLKHLGPGQTPPRVEATEPP